MVKMTKKSSPIRKLPGRGGLNDLQKSGRTIVDYSKATPMSPVEPNPAEIRVLGLPRR